MAHGSASSFIIWRMHYFGTDGIRGKADGILASSIAETLGTLLSSKANTVIVAKDNRLQSDELEKQLIGGLLNGDTQIFVTGVLPTPALAYLAKLLDTDYAVMVTASNSPPEWGGFKVLGKGGRRLTFAEEKILDGEMVCMRQKTASPESESSTEYITSAKLNNDDYIAADCAETNIDNHTIELCKRNIAADCADKNIYSRSSESSKHDLIGGKSAEASGNASLALCDNCLQCAECEIYPDEFDVLAADVSEQNYNISALSQSYAAKKIKVFEGAAFCYKRHIIGMFPRLDGIRVRLDCAYGTFAGYADEIFGALGVNVVAVNNRRDGAKINLNCGCADLSDFAMQVKRNEIGFAFDGDGDRVIAVVDGKIYDGDAILLALSTLYRLRGKLNRRFIVGTELSNSRLERELAWQSTVLLRTEVGDKFIAEQMRKEGCVLGGEKTGHILMLDKAETSDAMLTALSLLEAYKIMGSLPKYSPYPMKEFNIYVAEPSKAVTEKDFKQKSLEIEKLIAGKGRLIIRPSGTEPCIRITAEYFAKNFAEVFCNIENILFT